MKKLMYTFQIVKLNKVHWKQSLAMLGIHVSAIFRRILTSFEVNFSQSSCNCCNFQLLSQIEPIKTRPVNKSYLHFLKFCAVEVIQVIQCLGDLPWNIPRQTWLFSRHACPVYLPWSIVFRSCGLPRKVCSSSIIVLAFNHQVPFFSH